MHHPVIARPQRRAQQRQRGQVIPVLALSALVLLGASALAVDLTLQTHFRRAVQNVTDSAALAGAQSLIDPSSAAAAVQVGRTSAATEALKVLHNQLQFITANNWLQNDIQNANCNPGGSVCDIDNLKLYDNPSPQAQPRWVVSIDIPPTTAQNYGQPATVYNGDSHYIEITLRKRTDNGFGGVIGFSSSTEGGHSIAYHLPGNLPFGFALFANKLVTGGNQNEVISGDVYAGRHIDPQSSGQASFCAQTQANGTGGNILFGAPQYPPANSDDQFDVTPSGGDPDVLRISSSNCAPPGPGQNWVMQSSAAASIGNCPATAGGLTLNSSNSGWSRDIKACVLSPALTAPVLTQPNFTDPNLSSPYCSLSLSGGATYQPGAYKCTGTNQGSDEIALTVDHSLTPGVYDIFHNPNCQPTSCYDVEVTGGSVPAVPSSANCPTAGYQIFLCGVTFFLEPGATIGVTNGASAIITPYLPSNPKGNDGRFPVYSPADLSNPASVNVTNTNTTLALTGSVYMPNGSMNVGQNAFLYIQGQAVVDTWNVQSGNHPNPDITYDSGRTGTFQEIIRLVE